MKVGYRRDAADRTIGLKGLLCADRAVIRPTAMAVKAEMDLDRPRSLDSLAGPIAQRLEGGECLTHHPAAALG